MASRPSSTAPFDSAKSADFLAKLFQAEANSPGVQHAAAAAAPKSNSNAWGSWGPPKAGVMADGRDFLKALAEAKSASKP